MVSSSICHEMMGPDAVMLVFWTLSFKPASSLSSFTFIKRLFSSFSFSAISVVSSLYLRLLIFLLAFLPIGSYYFLRYLFSLCEILTPSTSKGNNLFLGATIPHWCIFFFVMSCSTLDCHSIFFHLTNTVWYVGSSVPPPRIKPMPPALGIWSLNHWLQGKSLDRHFLHISPVGQGVLWVSLKYLA